MLERTVCVRANGRLSGPYYLIELEAPEIAAAVKPGQFAHVRVPGQPEALLRRPFSIFKAGGGTISIVYKVVGRGTAAMAQLCPGAELSVIGPLGRGFTLPDSSGPVPLLVAGGYGIAALYLLAERAAVRGIVFMGGKSRSDIICEADFSALGWEVRPATEDGSYGEKGLVTEPVRALLERAGSRVKLFACGPMPMLAAVARLAEQFNVPAEVSADRQMCCGVGACLTCVIPVRTPAGWEYQRVCTEGPVFDARQIAWEMVS
ncbi:MAG: dihydroorotate dehydrogenase electron transfer subunit [Verrucomicrobiae bacterium]|nr:dihydroorotate dehydrogenase electron transfer subunit [Verrucomicrobiae bacterium]MCX7723008.1 dihydroorotate dehydrogenase electron transfer subunit [Verrucomicrobiae bacterium]MDW7979938.1 dihydroorotate dehydrogenase electron transfer subunit [Verrucomicrobiales bacterium]